MAILQKKSSDQNGRRPRPMGLVHLSVRCWDSRTQEEELKRVVAFVPSCFHTGSEKQIEKTVWP